MSDCAWCDPAEVFCATCAEEDVARGGCYCDPDGGVCHACAVWDGPPPPPDRAVGGYAYLMCEDAVPNDKEKTA